jgi:surface protein
MKKRITLCIILFVAFMSAFIGSANARSFYYFGDAAGLVDDESATYPFCDDSEVTCVFSVDSGVVMEFDKSSVYLFETDTNKGFNVVFSGESVSDAEITYETSDEAVISYSDIGFSTPAAEGDNTLTVDSVSGVGETQITLTAKIDEEVVARDHLNIKVDGAAGPEDFISTWTITGDDIANGTNVVTMPASSSVIYSYDGTINWGDGDGFAEFYSYSDESLTHTYTQAGTYNVIIRGTFEALDDAEDELFPSQMKTVENLGYIGWKTFNNAFRASALTSFSAGDNDTSGVDSMSAMFAGSVSLASVHTNNWDTTSVTSMAGMFKENALLAEIDVSNWDTTNVSSLSEMFKGAIALTGLDLSGFNTALATDMKDLFGGDVLLETLNLNSWDLTLASDVSGMFSGTDALTTVTYNSVAEDVAIYSTFLQRINSSDFPPENILLENGENGCDLADDVCFTTRDVLIADHGWTFETTEIIPLIAGPDDFVTTWTITATDEEVTMPTSATEGYIYTGQIDWGDGTGPLDFTTYNDEMFTHTYPETGEYTVIVRGAFEALDDAEDELFPEQMTTVENLGATGWKTLSQAFRGSSIASFVAGTSDTSAVTDMSAMFAQATSLESLDVDNLDTSSVINLPWMLSNATSLTSVDISSWDTSSFVNMAGMFNSTHLLTSLDLSGWDLSAAIEMGDVLQGTPVLETITYNVVSEDVTLYSTFLQKMNLSNAPGESILLENGENACAGLDNACFVARNALKNEHGWTFEAEFTQPFVANPDDFVTTWTTTAVDEEVTMPTSATEGYVYEGQIDWGDGTEPAEFTVYNDENFTHVYAEAGTYTVIVRGTFEALDDADDASFQAPQMKTVENLGATGWKTLFRAFGYSSLTSFTAGTCDISGASNMSAMLSSSSSLQSVDFTNFDTSTVTNMGWALSFAHQLSSLDLHDWDTSAVWNMNAMFRGSKFTTLDLSGWDLSAVTSITSMLQDTTLLETITYNVVSEDVTQYSTFLQKMNSSDFPGENVNLVNGENACTGLDAACFVARNALRDEHGWTFETEFTQPFVAGADDFVTTWTTTAADEVVTMPTSASYSYTGQIDWGDGTEPAEFASHNDEAFTHSYETPGTYTVIVRGTFEALDDALDALFPTQMKTVENLGSVGWKTFKYAFKNSSVISFNVGDSDFSGVTNMEGMFADLVFMSTVNTGNWDTGNITNMSYMFYNSSELTTVTGLNTWDTSSVTNMRAMFALTPALTALDISNFGVVNVSIMAQMFQTASSLTALDLSGWNMSAVTDVTSMFNNTPLLTTVTYNDAVDTTVYSTFLQKMNSSDFPATNIDFMNGTNGCDNADSACLAARDNLEETHGWVFEHKTIPPSLVAGADDFVTTWTVGAETVTMPTGASYNYSGLIDWGDGTGGVEFVAYDDENFTHTYETGGTYTVIVRGTFEAMDTADTALPSQMKTVENLGAVGWKTFHNAFRNSSITSFTAGNCDISGVTEIKVMFAGTNALTALNVSGLDTSNVTAMQYTFYGARSLTTLDLSAWDTSSATNMSDIFRGMSALTDLNLNGWNLSGITDTTQIFQDTTGLETLTYNEAVSSTIYSQFLQKMNSSDYPATNINFNNGENGCDNADSACLAARDNLEDNLGWVFEHKTLPPELAAGSADFVTTWTVGAGNTVTMPTDASYNYSGLIDWGDGTGGEDFSGHNDSQFTHTYESAGTYTVIVRGTFEALDSTQSSSFPSQMKTVVNLGSTGWQTLISAFGSSSITSFAAGSCDTSAVTSLGSMFRGASSLQSVNVNGMDTSAVTNMGTMFIYTTGLTGSLDLSSLSTASLTNIAHMFDGTNLTSINFGASFNTSKVTDLYRVFQYADNLTSLDLSNWDTSSATYIDNIFNGASSLQTLNLGSGWDYSGASATTGMFTNTTALNTITYTGAIDTTKYRVFLQEIQGINSTPNNINFENGDNMCNNVDNACLTAREALKATNNWTFENEAIPPSLNAGSADFVTTWTVGAGNTAVMPTSSSYSYSGLIDWGDETGGVEFSGYNDSNLTHTYEDAGTYTVIVRGTFEALDDANDTSFPAQMKTVQNLGSVGWKTFSNAFRSSSLTSFSAGSHNASGVASMLNMFANITSISSLNLSNLDTGGVTSMAGMFGSSSFATINVSNWNTSNVTSMGSMFNANASLTTITGLNTWDTSKVTNVYSMFANMTVLPTLDISGFDISSVTTMQSMFQGSSSLASLDVSSWDMSTVTETAALFASTSSLETLTYNDAVTSVIYSSFLQKMNSSDYPATNVDFDNGTNGCDNADTACITARDNLEAAHGWIFEHKTFPPELTAGPADFVTTWITTGSDEVVTMPTSATEGYVYAGLIDWGDGTGGEDFSGYNDAQFTHVYADAGTYTVIVRGTFEALDDAADTLFPSQMKTVENLGSTGWETLLRAFHSSSLTSFTAGNSDTSGITSTKEMFRSASVISIDVTDLDVSGVTDMYSVFPFNSSLTTITGFNTWDTSNVGNMHALFAGNSSLVNLDFSGWNLSNVSNVDSMFLDTTSLTTLTYNEDVDSTIYSTFLQKMNSSSHPATNIDFNNGTNICDVADAPCLAAQNALKATHNWVFETESYPPELTAGPADFVTTWTVGTAARVTMPTDASYNYSGLIDWGDGTGGEAFSGFADGNFSHVYADAGTYTVIVRGTFEALETGGAWLAPQMKTVENLGSVGWKTFSYAFRSSSLTSFTAGNSDTSGVTSMQWMFSGSNALTTIDMSDLDTSLVSTIYAGIYSMSVLTSVDMSGWDLSAMSNIQYIYYIVGNLDTLTYNTAVSKAQYSTFLQKMSSSNYPGDGLDFHNGTNTCDVLDEACFTARDALKADHAWVFENEVESQVPLTAGSADFVTTWTTTGSNETVTMPTDSGYSYSGLIDWGDGTGRKAFSGYADSDFSHTYVNSGTYTVIVRGTFEALDDAQDYSFPSQMKTVENLGSVGWKTLQNSLRSSSIVSFSAGNSNTSSLTNISAIFTAMGALTTADMSGMDVSNVTNFTYMFWDADDLTTVNLGGWDFPTDANLHNIVMPDNIIDTLLYNDSVSSGVYSTFLQRMNASSTPLTNLTFNNGSNNCDGDATCIAAQNALIADHGWVFQTESYPDPLVAGSADFVTTWTVGAGNTVSMPVQSGVTYSGSIDWGDGTGGNPFTNSADANFTHTYDSAGTYTVIVRGFFPLLENGASSPFPTQMKTVENLGSVGWLDFANAFRDSSLTSFNAGTCDTSGAGNYHAMFFGASNLSSVDLSCVTLGASVTNLSYMFYGTSLLTSVDLSNLSTSNVTSIGNLFKNTASLNSVNLSGWNLSSVTDVADIFISTPVLATITYNDSVSAATYSTFLQKMDSSNLPVSNLNLNNGSNICLGTDSACLAARDALKEDRGWIFQSRYYPPELTAGSADFVTTWTTTGSNETVTMETDSGYNYSGMIDWGDGTGGEAFSGYSDPDFTHTYASAGTYTVIVRGTFETMNTASNNLPNQLKTVENLGSVGWKTFKNAFKAGSSLTSFTAGSSNTSAVNDMTWTFAGSPSLTTIDLSGMNTSSITNMFAGIYNNAGLTSVNLGGWDLSAVTDVRYILGSTPALNTIIYNDSVGADQYSTFLQKMSTSAEAGDGLNFLNGSNVCDAGDAACFVARDALKADRGWVFQNENTTASLSPKSTDFVTTWTVGAGNTVRMPTSSDSAYSYSGQIDWGDGTGPKDFTSYSDGDFSHTYSGAGTYTVIVRGTFESLDSTQYSSFPSQMKTVENLGATGWKTFGNAFASSSITSFDAGSNDVSAVTNFTSAFSHCESMSSFEWTSFSPAALTGLTYIFDYTHNLASIDLSSWDVSGLISMGHTFRESGVESVNLSSWNLSSFGTGGTWSFINTTDLIEIIYNETMSPDLYSLFLQKMYGLTSPATGLNFRNGANTCTGATDEATCNTTVANLAANRGWVFDN